ncbi:MAG: hypothetical protein PVF45_01735 [Anaerolineae bacterium]|jgi:hypothetical protein
MKFVNEPTVVEARFEANGAVRPRRFTWEKTWLDVSDAGRQWVDAAGRHVLVMVAGRRTFELLLERESLSWRVTRVSKVKRKA